MEKLLHRTGFDPAADDYDTFRPSLRDTKVKTQDKTDSPDTGRRRSIPRWLSSYKEKTMNLCRGLVAKMTHGNAIRAGKGETEVPEVGRSSLFKAKNTHTSVLNKVCNTELNRQVHDAKVVKTGKRIRIVNWKENPEATCFDDSILFYTKDGESYTGDQLSFDLTGDSRNCSTGLSKGS